MDTLKEKGYSIENLDAVAARGGLLRPIESGTYKINDLMVEDLKNARYGLMQSMVPVSSPTR